MRVTWKDDVAPKDEDTAIFVVRRGEIVGVRKSLFGTKMVVARDDGVFVDVDISRIHRELKK